MICLLPESHVAVPIYTFTRTSTLQLEEFHLGSSNAPVNPSDHQAGSKCVSNETELPRDISHRPVRPSPTQMDRGEEKREQDVPGSPMIFPNSFRFHAPTKEGASEPDTPNPQKDLEEHPPNTCNPKRRVPCCEMRLLCQILVMPDRPCSQQDGRETQTKDDNLVAGETRFLPLRVRKGRGLKSVDAVREATETQGLEQRVRCEPAQCSWVVS